MKEAFEGGTDCAAVAKFVTPERPTGALCIMESGPGAYCTHDCVSDADCADLKRDGFRSSCAAGMCWLRSESPR